MMIERTKYLNQLIQFQDNDLIKVITGVRRSGKSVLLEQYRDHLLTSGVNQTDIIHLNFEDFDLQTIRTEDQLHTLLASKLVHNRQQYLLLDEIQQINGWQRVINGVRVSFNCNIVVTGSNASLLSGELATLISGRYVRINVFPFSFAEFLAAKNIDPNSRAVDQAFIEYEKFGGFPAVTMAQSPLKESIISGIYDSIILKDVAQRGSIRDVGILRALISYLADNVGQLVNTNKIVGTLNSAGFSTNAHTLDRYLILLQNAFLFYRAQQYDIRGRNYLRTAGKYFIVDNGLRYNAVGYRAGNMGKQLENIVYIELLRRGYSVDIGKLDSTEIDFIAKRHDEYLYIQVTYTVPENGHETDNLLHIPDNYKKVLITQHPYELNEIDGIPVIPVVDWLLNKN